MLLRMLFLTYVLGPRLRWAIMPLELLLLVFG